MGKLGRYLAVVVIALGVAALAVGVAFVFEGQAKANYLKDAMREEQITLGLTEQQVAEGNIVDTAAEAQKAGDTIREHRRSIAPTYNELLEGGRFDPTNTEHVTYMQALNLENYLYLAVASFGLVTVVQASGAAMIAIGIALGVTGVVLLGIRRAAPQAA